MAHDVAETTDAPQPRALHIVQIGFDAGVFCAAGVTDSRARQIRYGEILREDYPGSRITTVVIGASKVARDETLESVRFVPFAESRRSWRKPLAWLGLFRRLVALHRERPVDLITTQIVHDEAWVALLFRAVFGGAVVGQIHTDIFSKENRLLTEKTLLGRMRYRVLLSWLPSFDALRVVGQRIAAQLEERRIPSRIAVIPVAMPLLGSLPEQPSSVRPESPLVIFVGRLVPCKNLGAWIEVARQVASRLPECRFQICGDGPCRAELQQAATAAGLAQCINFSGWVAYDELPQVYAEASVFLLTSHYEGFGRVVAEALSQGVPVVAPRITGVEDIVMHGEAGFLHEVGDLTGMAGSVVRLLADPMTRARMGATGRTQVREQFDAEILSRRWVGFLCDVTRRSQV